MIKKFANIISSVFSPLLMPTYATAMALWMTILFVVPLGSKLRVTAVTFLLTFLLPIGLITFLYVKGFVKDRGLSDRMDRFIPYIAAAICYTALAFYFSYLQSPAWLTMFAIGAGLIVIVTAVINRWWKISAHAASAGAITTYIFVLFKMHLLIMGGIPLFISAIIIAGIVGTSRIVLDAHTPAQVLAGYANGVICILLTSLFY